MTIDRDHLVAIFEGLGRKLAKPTTVCLIGSSPGIASGQPDRQSVVVDVWRQSSSYDETELRKACQEVGILFDPKGELDPGAICFQIIRPGIVDLPSSFEVESIGPVRQSCGRDAGTRLAVSGEAGEGEAARHRRRGLVD
jgi:hypothetical protein